MPTRAERAQARAKAGQQRAADRKPLGRLKRSLRRRGARLQRDAERARIQAKNQIARGLRPGIKRLLRANRDKLVEGAYKHLRPRSVSEAERIAKAEDGPTIQGLIQIIYGSHAVGISKTDLGWARFFQDLLGGDLEEMGLAAFNAAGNGTMGALFPGESGFWQELFSADFVKEQGFDLAVTVQDSVKDDLRKAMATAFLEEQDPAHIRRALRRHLKDYEGWKLSRLVRTESNKAANVGALEAYDQSGVVEAKEWLNADPEAAVCIQLVGVIVPLKEPFVSSWGSFMAPPAHPNCESGVAPVVDMPEKLPQPRSKSASEAASKEKQRQNREAEKEGKKPAKAKLPAQTKKKPSKGKRKLTQEDLEAARARTREAKEKLEAQEAQNARLKAELERIETDTERTVAERRTEIARLEAEIARVNAETARIAEQLRREDKGN